MKKTFRLLSMAALALVGAIMTGCSSDDNTIDTPQQPENKSNVVTLTTTVGLNGGATTRALSETGVKTFAVDDQIAVVYKKKTGGATAVAVSEKLTTGDITSGTSATFTVTLDDPDNSQDVTYVYPAAMAKADGSINYNALSTQNGTRATLGSNLDLCTKSGAWDGDNLPTLTLENQLAILAITLKNAGGSSDITSSITGLTLSDGTYTYNVSRSAAAGPIYVAIRPTSDATITVTATDGTKNYTKTLTTKTYEPGNGYSVSWRMAEAGPTAYTLTESTVGMIVGSDGKAYDVADKDNLPTGVTAAGMVAYKSGSNGLVIALADEASTMVWSTANGASGAAAHTPAVTGQTWKLPSQDEWKQMFSANGGNENSYTGLNTAIDNAGGTALLSSGYWSSTENSPGVDAYLVDLYDGDANWYNGSGYYKVRACLAF